LVPKTQDTSGHLSQPELLQCDQVPAFLKTSRDIAALGFPTCCKTWQEWVTERRGAYSARVKLARLTSGKGFSSWPTISVNESKNSVGKSQEHRNSIPLGTMAAMQSWPTPNAQVSQDGESPETWLKRKEAMKAKGYNGNGCGTPLTIAVQLHGQAAPASSNSLGSRQGLWPTARGLDGQLSESLDTWEARRARKEAQGINLHRPLPIAVEQEQRKQWATPRNCGGPDFAKTTRPTSTSNSPSLPTQVAMQGWITPKASDGKSPGISRDIHLNHQAGGKLNPRWVETLMGLPIGWTMPSCTSPQTIAPMSCDSSAMELCQPPQSELSEFSLAS
jgi:hypothetical protein